MPENFDTLEEWQEYFDNRFPSGLSAFRQSDNMHFLSPTVEVLAVEDGEPTIEFFPAHIQTKQLVVRLVGVEEKSEKELLLKTEDDEDSNWVFSTNFDPAVAAELKAERDRLVEYRKLYTD